MCVSVWKRHTEQRRLQSKWQKRNTTSNSVQRSLATDGYENQTSRGRGERKKLGATVGNKKCPIFFKLLGGAQERTNQRTSHVIIASGHTHTLFKPIKDGAANHPNGDTRTATARSHSNSTTKQNIIKYHKKRKKKKHNDIQITRPLFSNCFLNSPE
jgi:hypothetical protein